MDQIKEKGSEGFVSVSLKKLLILTCVKVLRENLSRKVLIEKYEKTELNYISTFSYRFAVCTPYIKYRLGSLV